MSEKRDEMGFSEAMQDLEEILGEIEEDEVDIDALGSKLKRATELLEVCRKKIRKAEVEVSQIVEQLKDDGSETAAEAETDD